jgi:dienelactone hydrolase
MNDPDPTPFARRAAARLPATTAFAVACALLAGCGGSDGPTEAELAQAQRGDLVSQAVVAGLTTAQLDEKSAADGVLAFTGAAVCDVEVRSIVHRTVGTDGDGATASAALLIPRGAACPGPHPMLAYARGTDRDRNRTLADPADRETGLLMAMFAAQGYAVVATDYLGYAGSDVPFHPYLDADTEATTVIDSIRAARTALASLAVATTDRLFLTGYSQGGHATMAAHRAIERDRPAGVVVTASGPMSGPYDLLTSLRGGALLLPRLLADPGASATDRVAFRIGERLLAGELSELLDDPGRLLQALERESVVDWTPQAPMLMCHGSRDTVVPFANAELALREFRSRGATQVALVDVETVPEFAPALPPPGVPASELSGYHNRAVPPLCFLTVREQLFEPLR